MGAELPNAAGVADEWLSYSNERMMMRTSEKRARLKQLSTESQKNIHEMLRLAVEILDDHDYTDANGGQQKLMGEMETKDFAHFGGDPSLSSMLRAYRANPDIKAWQEHRFNVRAMIVLAAPVRPKQDRTPPVNHKKAAEELREKLAQKEAVLTKITNGGTSLPPISPPRDRAQAPDKTTDSPAAVVTTPRPAPAKCAKCEALQDEVDRLRQENTDLRNRVKRLLQVRTMLKNRLREQEAVLV
jgi:hypothetical protein